MVARTLKGGLQLLASHCSTDSAGVLSRTWKTSSLQPCEQRFVHPCLQRLKTLRATPETQSHKAFELASYEEIYVNSVFMFEDSFTLGSVPCKHCSLSGEAASAAKNITYNL